MIRTLILLALFTAAPVAAQFREDGEAARQTVLPKSKSNVWATLRTTVVKIDDKAGMFTATHPPAVKALAGHPLTVTGFMLPLEPAARVKHFLLSKYTPVCAFCPPGEPNEVVEVTTKTAVTVNTKLISVSGQFSLENNGDNGLFFKLNDATVGKAGS